MPALGFIIGLVGSGLAGFLGMKVSTKANVRVAAAASKSLADPMDVAFKGGSVTGIVVTGLALLGVAASIGSPRVTILMLTSSSAPRRARVRQLIMSVFARVGGGIYTKAADVGADLIGKVESGPAGRRSA